jgi:hypothetical protein
MKSKQQYVVASFAMLLLAAAAASCIETRSYIRLSEQKTKLYKTNLVGITGAPSSEPYVEIIYSADDGQGQGKNKTESLMVSPPYVFQNSRVNITYDSTIYAHKSSYSCKKRDESSDLMLKRSYEEGGADYFRIVNHSTDKAIEFFLAGAQDVEEHYVGLGSETILPSIYYRHAPVYYLLYPDKKYPQNLMWENIVFYFEGNRCGDLELTSAWSVEDVMQLYRAEYRRSPDTLLYLNGGGETSGVRMADEPVRISQQRLNPQLYGLIPPGGQFKGDENFWLPATPRMFFEKLREVFY